MTWLSSKDAPRIPRRDPSSPREPGVACGTLTPSFERGSVVLASGDRRLRLVWTGEAKPVAVPAGSWTLVNYKIERRHEGDDWHLSGSAPCGKGPAVEVKEGADAKLAIDDRVHLTAAVRVHGGKTHLTFGVKGHEGMGLSVVKEDARPTPSWAVLAGDRTLDSGDFRYG